MKPIVIALVLAVLAMPAAAQPADPAQPPSPAQPGAGAASAPPSTTAFQEAMQRMHMRMQIPYTGDADRDFVAGMIPHHQGAVEMAEIELRYGHDPALRKLARDIVATQREEIALMRRWQVRHGEKHAAE